MLVDLRNNKIISMTSTPPDVHKWGFNLLIRYSSMLYDYFIKMFPDKRRTVGVQF